VNTIIAKMVFVIHLIVHVSIFPYYCFILIILSLFFFSLFTQLSIIIYNNEKHFTLLYKIFLDLFHKHTNLLFTIIFLF